MNADFWGMENKHLKYAPDSTLDKLGFDFVLERVASALRTPEGAALLEELRPSADPEQIDRWRCQNAEIQELTTLGERLPIPNLEELEAWLEQIRPEGSWLTPEPLLIVMDHCTAARQLHTFLKTRRQERPELWKIASEIDPLVSTEELIRNAVSDQALLRDSASPELKRLRRELVDTKQRLRKTVQAVYRKHLKSGLAGDEGPTLRNGRMVIPLLVEHKRKVEGFIQDVSATGQTVYMEPAEALEINNSIRELEAAEEREEKRILQEIAIRLRPLIPTIHRNAGKTGQLDLIDSRTRTARQWNGSLPPLSDNGTLIIRDGKHPQLIHKMRSGSPDGERGVIPLNLTLEGDELGIVISGPNAGGKSVALKTAGLILIMQQSGIPVPVHPDSRLPVIDGIWVDIGDEQSIENDLSTFSSRLHWMKRVLERVGPGDLVLIDEAGTGTDPEEGGALFQAFIEALLEREARMIATTHHGVLKNFAHHHPALVNGSMEFDRSTLQPTWTFRKGIPGSSYAFEIAGRLDLPGTLLGRSRDLLGEQREKLAGLLTDLEERLQIAEQRRNEAEKLAQSASREREVFEEKERELKQERKRLLEKAWLEAEQIVKQANKKIENAVEKVGQLSTSGKKSLSGIRKDINEYSSRVRDKNRKLKGSKKERAPEENPRPGDRVRLPETDTTGELLELDGNNAVVLSNGLKLKTSIDNLEKVLGSAAPGRRTGQSKKGASWSGRRASTSLDLRGLRAGEAENRMMHYLDDVMMSGLREVEIIHGIGEGILQKVVHHYLESRKEVSGFQSAPPERGGGGCTIVRIG